MITICRSLFILSSILWATAVLAAPSISGVSGTIEGGETLVRCSNSISSGSSAGLKSASFDECYTVTNASAYWVIIAVDDDSPNAWSSRYDATGTGYYNTSDTDMYDNPPATLDFEWTSLNRTHEAYATVK